MFTVIAVIAGGVGCGVLALRQTGCFESNHERFRQCAYSICDGKGKESPRWSRRDYFSLYVDYLEHEDPLLRRTAAFWITTDASIPGIAFSSLADAYIAGDRDAELEAALLQAWRREKPNTSTTLSLAEAYVDLRRRQYLWEHPEFGRSIGLADNSPRSAGDIWLMFSRHHREVIDSHMHEVHDKEFERVLRNYHDLVDALRSGRLSPDN